MIDRNLTPQQTIGRTVVRVEYSVSNDNDYQVAEPVVIFHFDDGYHCAIVMPAQEDVSFGNM